MSMNSGDSASYENNLATLGYVDFDVPSGIDIYPKDFESKEQVVKILDDYNSKMEEEGKEEQDVYKRQLLIPQKFILVKEPQKRPLPQKRRP